jgi:endonuclease YncB( thermonuclease family)
LPSRVLYSLLFFALSGFAEEFRGPVVAILDGDTVEVLFDRQPRRVRLADIDAPEKGQAFGQRARQAASGLAFGRTVSVVAKGQDRYGRTLAEVFLPDGSSLNKRLVHDGWAWQYKRYSSDRGLAALEAEARQARRGLWADPHPIPPWEFRQSQRVPAAIRR